MQGLLAKWDKFPPIAIQTNVPQFYHPEVPTYFNSKNTPTNDTLDDTNYNCHIRDVELV